MMWKETSCCNFSDFGLQNICCFAWRPKHRVDVRNRKEKSSCNTLHNTLHFTLLRKRPWSLMSVIFPGSDYYTKRNYQVNGVQGRLACSQPLHPCVHSSICIRLLANLPKLLATICAAWASAILEKIIRCRLLCGNSSLILRGCFEYFEIPRQLIV